MEINNYNDIDLILNQSVNNSLTPTDQLDDINDRESSYVDNLNQELLIINNNQRGF